MQSSTLFILACILISTQAGNLDNIFEEAGQSEYAQNLVATIQLQMESGESVDTLIESMRGVQKGLRQQLADAEDVHDAKKQSCDDDLRSLASELTQAHIDGEKFAVSSQFDKATLESRQAEMKNKKRELKDRKKMMKTLKDQRQKEQEEYKALKEEYDSVFGVIEDCRAIIQDKLVAGNAFLESKTQIQTALLEKLNKFKTPEQGVAHGYGAFFKLLAQVVEKSMEVHADQAVVQRLFDIMDRIEENMEMAEAVERDAERTRQADYDELVEKVEAQLMYTQRQVVDLQGSISTLEDRIAASSARIANAMEAAANLQVRLEDRGAECQQDQAVWEQFSANMSAELSTAGKLMYLLEDKRALLARYGL